MIGEETLPLGELEEELEAVGSRALSWCSAVRTEDSRRQGPRPQVVTTSEVTKRVEATPREEATNRLWACLRDVVAFAPAVRHLHEIAHRGHPRLVDVERKAHATGTTEQVVREFNEARRPADAFVASMKGMHFLIRAFQDAAYVVLFELLEGTRPGKARSSMQRALASEDNPVRVVLDKHWPTYVPWFARHRALRNAFKDGLLSGWSYVRGAKSPLLAMTGTGISLDTIDEGLRQSASLMGIIVEEAGRIRGERANKTKPAPAKA